MSKIADELEKIKCTIISTAYDLLSTLLDNENITREEFQNIYKMLVNKIIDELDKI